MIILAIVQFLILAYLIRLEMKINEISESSWFKRKSDEAKYRYIAGWWEKQYIEAQEKIEAYEKLLFNTGDNKSDNSDNESCESNNEV